MASQWMGWENVFQVERDKYCQQLLAKNFPKVKRYEEIKEFDGTKYKGAVDIITGGFPCQPFSEAGKRKGTEDDRYLWPEMLRVIREVNPSFVVGENVTGITSMEDGKTLDGILTDLEDEGFAVEPFAIPACSVGAWHRRERIWIIAYPNNARAHALTSEVNQDRQAGNKERKVQSRSKSSRHGKDVTNAEGKRLQGRQGSKDQQAKKGKQRRGWPSGVSRWEAEPNVGRVASGISRRVDRLKGLGNSVVPQVVYEIFKAIEKIKI